MVGTTESVAAVGGGVGKWEWVVGFFSQLYVWPICLVLVVMFLF